MPAFAPRAPAPETADNSLAGPAHLHQAVHAPHSRTQQPAGHALLQASYAPARHTQQPLVHASFVASNTPSTHTQRLQDPTSLAASNTTPSHMQQLQAPASLAASNAPNSHTQRPSGSASSMHQDPATHAAAGASRATCAVWSIQPSQAASLVPARGTGTTTSGMGLPLTQPQPPHAPLHMDPLIDPVHPPPQPPPQLVCRRRLPLVRPKNAVCLVCPRVPSPACNLLRGAASCWCNRSSVLKHTWSTHRVHPSFANAHLLTLVWVVAEHNRQPDISPGAGHSPHVNQVLPDPVAQACCQQHGPRPDFSFAL